MYQHVATDGEEIPLTDATILIFLVIGLVLGAATATAIARGRIGQFRASISELAGRLELTSKQHENAARRCHDLEREAVTARAELEREIVRLGSELKHEKTLAEEKLASVARTRDEMSDHLRALCGEALKDNGKQFLELAKAQLSTLQAEGRADLEQRQNEIAQAVRPIRESLSKVDTKLERLEQDRRRTQGALEAQMRSVADGQRELHVETGALVAALRQPQTRGRWGEMQLKRVVEMAGMLPYCDFVEQSQIEADGQVLRPDLIINLPGEKHVVVDAKAPLQAYLDAHEAQDEDQRQGHVRQHARQLREHIKRLSSKAYWGQFDSTPDFVFLFLPGEHFYNAALEAEPRLIEEGVNQCVIVATPMTLITLLRAVAYGWQQEKVAEDARAIAELGRELHHRLSVYVEHMEKLGRRLNSAVGAFNDAVGSLESRVLPGARRFAEHGAVSAAKDVAVVQPIESTSRAIRAPELVEAANGVSTSALPPVSGNQGPNGADEDVS